MPAKPPVYHFPLLVNELHAILHGKAPAEAPQPVMAKAFTDAHAFWGRKPAHP
jgi:hypothetical protein